MPVLDLPNPPNSASNKYKGTNGQTQYQKDMEKFLRDTVQSINDYTRSVNASVGSFISVVAPAAVPALEPSSSLEDVASTLCTVISLLQKKGILASKGS